MSFTCPHCLRSLGGTANDGQLKVRLAITLLDPKNGRVHGPCSYCKGDVTIAEGSTISKAFSKPRMRLGLPIPQIK